MSYYAVVDGFWLSGPWLRLVARKGSQENPLSAGNEDRLH